MNKTLKNLSCGFLLLLPLTSYAFDPIINNACVQLSLSCHIDDKTTNQGIHRTPPQIPNVYYDASASTVYFENPCYECTLELVVPGTDAVTYSYIIPDGDDTVQLPTVLSGEYELHIHRGNYCFWGVIELDR